jgi:hypothetical protein
MSQLAPVDEVSAVENRQTWKIFKRGVHQVILLTHPTDRWVRIEAWQNRVTKCSGHGAPLGKNRVMQNQDNRKSANNKKSDVRNFGLLRRKL